MHRRVLLFTFITTLLWGGMLGFSQPTAEAAPPPNDDLANRIIVTNGDLPYTDTVDTTDATDEVGEEFCPNISTGTSKKVWYEFTPTVAGTYQIDTFGRAIASK